MEGSTFGPYTIEELLGRGGMGEVYRAFDTETDREVALKVLPPHLADDPEYTERFRRECRSAAKLRDPHVVPIHRYGEIDGRLYLDMRLVSGSDLGTRLAERGPLSPAAAVSVVSQIASALDSAHAEGMVHRDVKPSNILLTGPEDNPVELFAYLFDFGIASSTGVSAGDEQLTRSGTVPGSVAYLAPERFHGVPADPRVDVYALACVLHQSLTGKPPFAGDLPTLMHAHLHLPVPLIDRADVPAGLDDVVARGMAKDPAHRYPTAGALAAAARAAVDTGPVALAPPTATDTPRPSTFGAGTWTPGAQGPSDPRGSAGSNPQGAWAGSDPQGRAPSGPGWGQQSGSGWGGPSDPRWSSPQNPVETRRSGMSTAALVVLVVALVVLLGGLGTAGWLLIGRVSGGGTPATPTAPPTPTPTPTPQTVPGAEPGSGDAALLAALPAGFSATNCTPDVGVAASIGGTSYLACENGPADGPDGATFSRYDQQSLLDAGFDGAATAANVPQKQDAQHADCRTGVSLATGYAVNDKFAGRVGCYLDPSGAAYLFWSDNAALSFGYLRRTDGNAAVLYDWWVAHDFAR
ncbi:serine/threonine-protein kinase [Pseudonocardia xishanensis]|uniref:non-specific serine/threonine protein kinase n=1 Tax=Pseudonocardia xishanensis TaxID=630995 RepID=A0ABP8RW01_9PSEU